MLLIQNLWRHPGLGPLLSCPPGRSPSTASWVFLVAGGLQGRDGALFLPRSPRHCAWCGRTILGVLPTSSPLLRLLWVIAWRHLSLCGHGRSFQASTGASSLPLRGRPTHVSWSWANIQRHRGRLGELWSSDILRYSAFFLKKILTSYITFS